MALIKCPECKGIVSHTADACPHCGYKLTEEDIEKGLKDAALDPVPNLEKQKENTAPRVRTTDPYEGGTFGGGFALGFVLGLIGLIIAACAGKRDTKNGALFGFIIQAIIGGIIYLMYFLYTTH